MRLPIFVCYLTACFAVGDTVSAAPISVKGRVVDPQGGKLPDTKVYLIGNRPAPTVLATAMCGKDGNFELRFDHAETKPKRQPTAVYILAATPGRCGFYSVDLVRGDKNENAEVILPARQATVVRVVDPQGEPLAGAVVEVPYVNLRGSGSYAIPAELQSLFRATTNTDGSASIEGLPLLHFGKLQVRTDAYGLQALGIDLERRVLLHGRVPALHLRDVGRLEGNIVFPKDEKPHAIRLRITSTTSLLKHPQGLYSQIEIATDKTGRFVVPAIAEGDIQIKALLDGDSNLIALPLPEFSLDRGQIKAIDVPLAIGVQVTGSVVAGKERQPVANWTFTLQKQQVTTDKAGQFTARLLPGEATLYSGQVVRVGKPQAEYSGLLRRKFEIPEVREHALPEVVLAPYIALPGRLIDKEGKPVAGWNVQASSPAAATDYSLGETDAAGSFDGGYPEDCPPAEYRINRLLPRGNETITQWGEVRVLSVQPLLLEFSGTKP